MGQEALKFLSLDEVSTRWGVRPAYLRAHSEAGHLTHYIFPRQGYHYQEAHVEDFVAYYNGDFEIELEHELYVVGFADYVKIGISNEFHFRIKTLQTGCPEVLIVYNKFEADRDDERSVHKRFASSRLQGEWFRYSGPVKEWIDAGCPI